MSVNVFDPFANAEEKTERKKRAFLVGSDPKSRNVQYLYNLALYRGRSVNIYSLLDGRHRAIARPDQAMIDEVLKNGHEIEHPAIPHDDVDRWVAHAKREALRLGLTVKA